MRAALLTTAALAGALAIAALVAGVGGGRAGESAELLPDLVVKVPYDLELTQAGGRWRLGFASAASNFGAGPLVVQGRRRPGAETMATVQEIRRADGSVAEVRGAGRLRYVVSSDHQHWHFLPFMRYELRRADGTLGVVRDRKTGFCLGDRYETDRELPGKPDLAGFFSRCGLRETWRLGVREGISVGYGDDYNPTLEGQFVDVTGLPAGRYVLTHRVNETRVLREGDYDDNASSLLVALRWRAGTPSVAQVRRCPGSETCAMP